MFGNLSLVRYDRPNFANVPLKCEVSLKFEVSVPLKCGMVNFKRVCDSMKEPG